MNRATTSQTEMERERQRRICVALWAYAYEIEADPLGREEQPTHWMPLPPSPERGR